MLGCEARTRHYGSEILRTANVVTQKGPYIPEGEIVTSLPYSVTYLHSGEMLDYDKFIPITGPRMSPVSLFFVTTSTFGHWVICVPAAFLRCGSRF